MTQIRTPLPVYATGTVASAANSPVVTGTATAWMANDAYGNSVNTVMGGDLFITATAAIPIRSVDSASQITLEVSTPAIAAGSSYRIVKISPNLSSGITQALGTVLGLGSDTTPDNSRTIDNGAARAKLRVSAAGTLQLAVGLSGALDSALVPALDITAGGTVTIGNGLVTPYITGENLVINGNFAINQRGYVSGSTLATNSLYAHDRFCSIGSTSYTFTQGTPDTLITVTSGTLDHRIDPVAVAGGNYVFSWSGTIGGQVLVRAPGATGNTVYASGKSPLVATSIPAGSAVFLRTAGLGTYGLVQFEQGTVPTPFDRRPYSLEFMLAQRFYQVGRFRNYTTTTYFGGSIMLPQMMRAAPTVTYTDLAGTSGCVSTTSGGSGVSVVSGGVTASRADEIEISIAIGSAAGNSAYLLYTLSAEL